MLLNQKISHYLSGNTGLGLEPELEEPEPKLWTKEVEPKKEPEINNFGSATLFISTRIRIRSTGTVQDPGNLSNPQFLKQFSS